ncbi:MAG: 16S rRNA (cytidine(1402)-2'-O)-methyltransferase, partial [Clostridia bacterium]|nr:16S rRNA (cytidine(1402)-2'-O)-methyltransferase [Clostridia bacterium]
MLYVVATPIGNLGDMSPRAVETLKSVALIAAEDTRVTMKLTAHFDIHTPLTSCHQHNEHGKAEQIVARMLAEGIDVALVTDAGTPAISDPGTYLVRLCAESGIPIAAVPGPTAMASAVSVSGFDFKEFTFYGFLPREKKELTEKLRSMIGTEAAVIHESPFRVIKLMETIRDTLPGVLVSASCDLTKLHELTLRGTADEVLNQLYANEKAEKGEYCIVLDLRGVSGETQAAPPAELSPELRLLQLLLTREASDLRDAREKLISDGIRKNEAYAASLKVKEF